MSYFQLQKGVYKALASDTSILSVIGYSDIYHGIGPDSATMPRIIFQFVDDPYTPTFCGGYNEVLVQVDIYDDVPTSATRVNQLHDYVNTALNRVSLNTSDTTFMSILLLNARPAYRVDGSDQADDRTWRATSTFELRYT